MFDANRARLPESGNMLFNSLIRGLLPKVNKDPINVDNDDLHHQALEAHHRKKDKV